MILIVWVACFCKNVKKVSAVVIGLCYKNLNMCLLNHFSPTVFSSLSLGLLPERSATLMVYDDVVQIVSGFQGMLALGNQNWNLRDTKEKVWQPSAFWTLSCDWHWYSVGSSEFPEECFSVGLFYQINSWIHPLLQWLGNSSYMVINEFGLYCAIWELEIKFLILSVGCFFI